MLDHFGSILLNAGVATTILLSLVVMLMVGCRHPARRIVLAHAAILAALLILPLAALAPLPRFDPVSMMSRLGLIPQNLTPRQPSSSQERPPSVPDTRRPDGTSRPLDQQPSRLAARSLSRLLTGAYLTGVAFGLAWFLLGCWAVNWLIRGADEPTPSTAALYRELLQDEAGYPKPGLKVTARVRRPSLAGLTRSCILIPSDLDHPDMERETLRLILLHELAHARQRDPWFGSLASLAQTLWFFLPHLWWIRAQLRIDREFLADQIAVEEYGTSAGYARRLVALATPGSTVAPERTVQSSAPASGWRSGGFGTPLLQRVVMLLHCPFEVETQAPLWWSRTLPAIIITGAILLSSLCLPGTSGDWSLDDSARLPTASRRVFQVPEFVAAPQTGSTTHRIIPYTLPLPLPSQFELTAEIEATSAAFAEIRLIGHRLDPNAVASTSSTLIPDVPERKTSEAPVVHHIRIVHDAKSIRLWVDQQDVPVKLSPKDTTQWLIIEPSSHERALFRNLTVTW